MTDLVQRMRARAAPEPNSINAMAEDLLAQAADRIEALEAALREIADTKDSKDLGLDEPETYDDQNMIDTLICIARRALEGRHE